MSLKPSHWFRAVVPLATVVGLAACSDDDPTGNEATLLGSWETTSFVTLGTDLIADGMTLDITLAETGMYTFDVTNDQVGACGEEGPDCETTGPFTFTSSQVTIDAGEADSVTFSYTVSASVMTWIGAIDEVPVTLTFSRK